LLRFASHLEVQPEQDRGHTERKEQPERRPERLAPLIHKLVAEGTLPDAYATDNGAGLVYHGTELYEAITETPRALAYEIRREGDSARETPLPTRVL